MEYKTTWDLNLIYSDINDPKIDSDIQNIKDNSYSFINKWKDRTDYLTDINILKEALDDYENWAHFYSSCFTPSYYFWLKLATDQNNSEYKAKYNKINEISVQISNDINFFELNLVKISKENQDIFLKSEILANYSNFLSRIFKSSKYLLSEKEERILNLKNKTSFENWSNLMDQLLSKEEREINGVKYSFSELLSKITDSDKNIRTQAFNAVNNILKKNSHIAEIEFNSVLEDCKIDKQIRGYERYDSARHNSDDLDSSVVDSLIDSVSKRFDIAKKFYELKAKLFGVDKLEYGERCLEYGNINKEYNFEDSIKLVGDTFNSIDPEFFEIFKYFLNGHIDVFPKNGKMDGAFCTSGLKKDPIYILLNHTNKLNDVLTIAHECGHGINDYLMIKNQNALNFGNSLATAEVASTFFEDFVLETILKNADDELKLAILMMKLNGDISTIFRQAAFYQFETEVHTLTDTKGYLSKEEIGEIFQKHMKEYMGDFVNYSEGTENWWIYVGHFRMPFYVYSYVSGLLISKAMQNKFKNNHKFISKIKEFLSTGLSKTPKDTFLNMEIDISDNNFWNNGLDEVENLLNEAWELAKKLGKIN